MLVDDLTLYEKQHFIIVNDIERNLFYYFDYDERSYQVNMEFQHFHSFFEIAILLGNDAVHLIEGRPYQLQTNDIVLLAPSVFHKTVYPKGESSKRIIISFLYPDNLFGMEESYQELLKPFYSKVPIYRFNRAHQELIFSKLNDIFRFSKTTSINASPLGELILHNKFIDFLYQLKALENNNIYQNETIVAPSAQKIYDVCSFIHNHFHEDISLNTLAKEFFISPYYLSHQFKKVTDFTISSYIQMTRIKNAQYMLLTTNDKISDIAESCGFTSFSQFNRCFRKLTQTSPRDFRVHSKIASI